MPSSWAQHDTVVAERSRAQVADLFREAGRPIDMEASAPILLTDRTMSWYLDKGEVDLFFVDVTPGGEVKGRRHFFVRVAANELILALEPLASLDPNLSFGVLAVGSAGTLLYALPEARLHERAERTNSTDALHGAIDVWVRRLSGGLSDEAPPAQRSELLPGTVELEPGMSAAAGPKTIWFSQVEGESKLVGVSSVRAKAQALLPLTRETWITAETKVVLKVVDSQTYFRWDKELASVRRFHRFVLDCLARRRASTLALEQKQIIQRETTQEATVNQALSALAIVDEGNELDVGPAESEPILLAFRTIANVLGVKVSELSLKGRKSIDAEDLARAAKVRVRPVVLPKDWRKMSSDPLLAFVGSDRPVALLPRRFGGFDVFDPKIGARVKASEETTKELLPQAFLFYRPLPARPLTVIDLLRFSLRGSLPDFANILFTGVLLGVLAMVVPLATGEIVDRIIPSAEIGPLIQIGAMIFTVAIVGAFVQMSRGATALRLELNSSAALQAAVWDRLLGLPVAFFRKFSAGDLAVRANGVESIRQALSGSTLGALLGSISALMNFAVMFALSPQLAGIAGVLALGSVAIAAGVGVTAVLVQRDLAGAEGRLSSLVLQLLTGMTKLRIAGAEGRAFALWAKEFLAKRTLALKGRAIENRMAVISTLYPAIMTAVIFWMVASAAKPNRFGTGDFLAFNAAFGIFIGGLVELVRTGVGLLRLVPVIERARPLFEAVPEVDEQKLDPGELRGAIQVTHVSYRYSTDGPQVLHDVNFEVKPGELVAIVGSSAAGKSTLLRVLLGFERPETGGVFFDRQDLGSLDVTAVRRQVGVVLQSSTPIAGDILENILGSRPFTLEDAWAAARMAGLEDDIKRMPMGMHTVLSQGGLSLSGGQRQRLMIARAIVAKPRILFFDEATSALDNKTQAMVTESLERLQATRVVIAHRLSTIRNADRIIVMENGKKVQEGSYDELMAVKGQFQDLAKRQVA